MALLQNLPFKRKLMMVVLLTTLSALVLMRLVSLSYEFLMFRKTTLRQLATVGEVIASNSSAALAFDNPDDAKETLAALQAEPHITAAALYDKSGKLFAKYPVEVSDSVLPAAPQNAGYRFEKWTLIGFQPVAQAGRPLGMLYLKFDAGNLMKQWLGNAIALAVLVIAISALLAFQISKRLQKQITQPIFSLTDTSKAISERRDYSVRAKKMSNDELGTFTDVFNEMLSGIEDRERALSTINESLRTENTERKQAEEALRANQAQLQATVDNIAEGVAVSNPKGELLHFNRAALAMHGFTDIEECRRHLAEFTTIFELSTLDGALMPLDQWPLSRILRGEKLRNVEVIVRNKKAGWQRIYNYGGTLIYDANQQPLLAVITISDITDRKQFETKLQTQLGQLNLLNQITRAIGERQDLPSIFQVVIRRLEDNLPIDFSCVCLYDQPNNSLTVTSVGIRSESTAMDLAMTENARVPIDQNGLSRCVMGQLVYEPDISDVKFPFPQRLFKGGLRAFVAAPLLVESKVFGVLIAARRKADSFTSSECEFLKQLSEHVALASHQVQLYNALHQAYDDLRQSQQTVMQQERLRALGQMASGIAHDINNAISPVALYVESMLENEPNLTARSRDYLQTIERAIDDVSATVARMREFYRQREPQLLLNPVKMNQLVQQVIDLTRARWCDMPQQRGVVIRMATELAPELPPVMGVESEIREALTNLIFNAVDAMPEGGTLTLRTRVKEIVSPSEKLAAGRYVLVDVSDTGIGMNEDTRRRCLEPFFTTKGERGTGLGLAMVYGVVKRHNADIEIISFEGKGTTMRLSFSVAPAPSGQPTVDTAPFTVPRRLRLLVVDDDPLLIKSLRDTLETDGHLITTANGGQAGIDAFRGAQASGELFAAVITDLGMPYVDGRKVSAAIKKMSPTTPVIMLTGWGQRLVAEGDIPPHVDRVLNKPPKLRELREALAKCLNSEATVEYDRNA